MTEAIKPTEEQLQKFLETEISVSKKTINQNDLQDEKVSKRNLGKVLKTVEELTSAQ